MSTSDNGPPLHGPGFNFGPEDIESRVAVVKTTKGGTVVLFPPGHDGYPDLHLAINLLISGAKIVADMLKAQDPGRAAGKIVLVPAAPPGIDLRGKAGE